MGRSGATGDGGLGHGQAAQALGAARSQRRALGRTSPSSTSVTGIPECVLLWQGDDVVWFNSLPATTDNETVSVPPRRGASRRRRARLLLLSTPGKLIVCSRLPAGPGAHAAHRCRLEPVALRNHHQLRRQFVVGNACPFQRRAAFVVDDHHCVHHRQGRRRTRPGAHIGQYRLGLRNSTARPKMSTTGSSADRAARAVDDVALGPCRTVSPHLRLRVAGLGKGRR